MRWIDHVNRMPQNRIPRLVYDEKLAVGQKKLYNDYCLSQPMLHDL